MAERRRLSALTARMRRGSPLAPGLPVAVDAMGGDHAPHAVVAGALKAVQRGLQVTLVGDRAVLEPLVPRRLWGIIHHAAESVGMDEKPGVIRRRPEASMRVAMRLVNEGLACAAVSCGNSGAALFGAVLDFGVQPGVDRPALATVLPRGDGGRLILVDSGANVDCKAEQLVDFAILGSAYAQLLGVPVPRVGLLSNGEEEEKGNALARQTLPLLRATSLAVVGNVEPHDALAGKCDVLVCDGFVGNILLKTVEAAAATVVTLLKREITRNFVAIAAAWVLQPAFRRLRSRVAWESQGGAVLLGCNGLMVVGHGRANADSVGAAIRLASAASALGLVARLGAAVAPPEPPAR